MLSFAQSLTARLPARFRGWPVRFGWDEVAVTHHVTVTTLPDWLQSQLGVDASAGVNSQTDPLPVVLRITGPARSVADNGRLLTTKIQGCLINGAARGDLSSEKVYVKLQKMTCAQPGGRYAVSEVKGFIAFGGKSGVRGRVVEPAVVGGEAVEHGLEQVSRALEPERLAGRAGQGEVPGGQAAVVLQDAGVLVADYSTGMRKKIALAAALLHAPHVLFLDEPFESVDPVSARSITEVLSAFRSRGGTVVFSSHVMDTVERLCDHVAIVAAGQIVRTGPIDAVRDGRRLEDVFIETVGVAPTSGSGLDWLQ